MLLEVLKKGSIDLSADVNDCLFKGNILMTTSRQSTRGYQKRADHYVSDKQAIKVVHTKMGVAATGIIASLFLWKVHPILGILSFVIGAYKLYDVREDW